MIRVQVSVPAPRYVWGVAVEGGGLSGFDGVFCAVDDQGHLAEVTLTVSTFGLVGVGA
jgi:hypothetical protein